MNIYLIRHTSVDVPKGLCYGQSDVPLRPTFEAEAAVTKAKINPRINEIIASGIVYFIPADINSGKELITVCHIYFHLLFLCNILKIKMLLVLSPTNSIHRFKYLITYIRLNIPSLA